MLVWLLRLDLGCGWLSLLFLWGVDMVDAMVVLVLIFGIGCLVLDVLYRLVVEENKLWEW